jgi:hypothetical protein
MFQSKCFWTDDTIFWTLWQQMFLEHNLLFQCYCIKKANSFHWTNESSTTFTTYIQDGYKWMLLESIKEKNCKNYDNQVKVYNLCTSIRLVAPNTGQKSRRALSNLGLGNPSLYKNVLSMCVISGLRGDHTDKTSVSFEKQNWFSYFSVKYSNIQ